MKEVLTLLIVRLAVIAYQLILLTLRLNTIMGFLVDEAGWTGFRCCLYDPFDLRKLEIS